MYRGQWCYQSCEPRAGDIFHWCKSHIHYALLCAILHGAMFWDFALTTQKTITCIDQGNGLVAEVFLYIKRLEF